jgi:phage head maturation protease
MSIYLGNLEPGARYRIDSDGRAIKTKSSARKQILDGWAVHYNVVHTNFKTMRDELFLPGYFSGTIWGVLFQRDHLLSEKSMASQDDGDMELLDSDAGLAMRVHLNEGVFERLEGRRQLSVGYRTMASKIRSDGVKVIQRAALVEVSACNYAAVRQCFFDIRDADEVGTLAHDSKNFAYQGASLAFTRALRDLQRRRLCCYSL